MDKKRGIFKNKKAMEVAEIGKIVLAVVVLAVLAFMVLVLFKGKGGETLAKIKDVFRFGRA